MGYGWHMPNLDKMIRELLTTGDLDSKVSNLNHLRQVINECSPFRSEPVDLVEWVKADTVSANDYNPNAVAPPEMELLKLSIQADGFTQPIVTLPNEEGDRTVIDGFHRHRVGKESPEIQARIHGYLPVVRIREDRTDRGDRIAATIRHNRARGKHQVVAMSDIVLELKRRNWSDDKVARELGMDPEQHYADKILLFQKWWMARGYPDGIPDEAPYALEAKRLAPSWRRVCKSLLRNDYWGKGLGFSQHKSSAYSQYQDLMRRRRESWGVSDGSIEMTRDLFTEEEVTA